MLNTMSDAASVVRGETSSESEDKLILEIYKKAVSAGLDVYPIVSEPYLGKDHLHMAKTDEEIVKVARFKTKPVDDDYPEYSRLWKDTSYDLRYSNSHVYTECSAVYNYAMCYTIHFTLNGHKYGVDFDYSLFDSGFNSCKHISSVYSMDIPNQEFYSIDEVPYRINDITHRVFNEFEYYQFTYETKMRILDSLNEKLRGLEVGYNGELELGYN